VTGKEIRIWVTEGNSRGCCNRRLSFWVTSLSVGNLKDKVALCMPQVVWLSIGIAPRILNPGIRWRLVVTFLLVLLQRKERYALSKRPGGPQNFGEGTYLFPLAGIESCSPVVTMLSATCHYKNVRCRLT